MTTIRLQAPSPMSRDLEQLHYFPGRTLGEREFDRRQRYMDARLAPLALPRHPGVVRGLEVSTVAPDSAGEGCVVGPGLAVSGTGELIALYAPLHQRWQELVEAYLARTAASGAAGVFYLLLRRDRHRIDVDPEVDACQRSHLDPTRDARRLVVGSLALRRLSLPADVATTAARERIANRVAAERVDGTFMRNLGDAVPLGLLAVEASADGHAVSWFSAAAGRYPARPDGGYRALLAQVDEAFRRALAVGDDLTTAPALDFLPAAGALPRGLLQDTATRRPTIKWLPSHLGLDMVPVPEDSASEIVTRHLARRPVDLRRPTGERLRLLLAVDASDYRPQLLDFPQRDPRLIDDLFRYHRRAHEAWRGWRRQYNHLYSVQAGVDLESKELKALDLPPAAPSPPEPESVFQAFVDAARDELASGDEAPPYPYDQGTPTPPDAYREWLVPADPQDPEGPAAPPGVEPPESNGLVIRYALARHDLERTENRIRAVRSRLDKSRDYILVQRQQLDSQTVSFAALAGGVASDGSGLQVSRWLPYTQFSRGDQEDGSEDNGSGETDGGGGDGGRSLRLDTTFSAPAQVQLTSAAQFAADRIAGAGVSVSPRLRESTFSTVPGRDLVLKPRQSSALEFSINRRRIEKLAEVPKQPLTKPAFVAREERFGVLSHLKPEESEYRSAHRSMAELTTTVDGLFDANEAASIKRHLRRLGTLRDPDQLNEGAASASGDPIDANVRQRHYEELFNAGRLLARQIAFMETRQSRLEAQLQARLRDQDRLLGQLAKLAGLITEARERLSSLDGRRVERLGDYGVAQRLTEEDWRQVFQRNRARGEILTERVRGLYYVRVRDAAVSRAPAEPLILRHGESDEPVPGCDWDVDAELPESLAPFFEAVLEVPVDDWRGLRPLRFLLPTPSRLQALFQLRETRFRLRSRTAEMAPAIAAPQLQTLALQNRAVLQDFAARRLPRLDGSLKRVQAHSAQCLSLEDVLSGGSGRLRRQAEQLRDRLEQASACLITLLRRLPPSLRLQWSELAEEDRLSAHNVAAWPGLERAERGQFNTTRTLAELVSWWFERLVDGASAASRSALRNLVRAAVIHSALGDPSEILQGRVQVPPRTLAPGERLRLDLNRMPSLGDTLQLLNPAQQVVGMVRVEDHDERGTIAEVVEAATTSAAVNTRFTAVASGLNRTLRG